MTKAKPNNPYFADTETALFAELTTKGLHMRWPASSEILLIAFDEVGRGCVAGPVAAGCTIWLLTDRANNENTKWLATAGNINDSKKLSEKKRFAVLQELIQICPMICDSTLENSSYALNPADHHGRLQFISTENIQASHLANSTTPHYITLPAKKSANTKQENTHNRLCSAPFLNLIAIAVGCASAAEIDKNNIWNAVQLAMARAFYLARQNISHFVNLENATPKAALFVDGNLPIKVEKAFATWPQILAPAGDARFLTLGASSIIAKVCRDIHMSEIGKTYPSYLFGKHKGYGTPEHLNLLKQYSLTPLHRSSFLRNL